MNKYPTGAYKEDKAQKGKPTLLPFCALMRISKHMQCANKPIGKYDERNWEKGLPISELMDSVLRHIFQYMDGMADEDHLCAAATNLLMAMWTEEKHPELQDIPSRAQEDTSLASNQSNGTYVPPDISDGKETQREDIYHYNCKYRDTPITEYPCSKCKDYSLWISIFERPSFVQEDTALASEHMASYVKPPEIPEYKEEQEKGQEENITVDTYGCRNCKHSRKGAVPQKICISCDYSSIPANEIPSNWLSTTKWLNWCLHCTAQLAPKDGRRCGSCDFPEIMAANDKSGPSGYCSSGKK